MVVKIKKNGSFSFNSELKTFLSVDEFHTDVGFFMIFQSAPTPELLTDWVSVLRQAMQLKSFEKRRTQSQIR